MIHTLPSPKTNKGKVQVGRGPGSGHGAHTTGRGTKGQKSRAGYTRSRPGFEGGQMPLSRRLPKLKGFTRGFAEANRKHFTLQLSEVVAAVEGDQINADTILESGLLSTVSKKLTLKIVFDQKIEKAVTVEGIPVSESAKAAIEAAGGQVL